jgi:hypothetical protein
VLPIGTGLPYAVQLSAVILTASSAEAGPAKNFTMLVHFYGAPLSASLVSSMTGDFAVDATLNAVQGTDQSMGVVKP